jgi:hypothetical protein
MFSFLISQNKGNTELTQNSGLLNKLYRKALTESSNYLNSFGWNYILAEVSNENLKKTDSFKDYTFLDSNTVKNYLIENKLKAINCIELSHKIISKDTIDINWKLRSIVLGKKKRKNRKSRSDKFNLFFSGCGLTLGYKPNCRFFFDKQKNDWVRLILKK